MTHGVSAPLQDSFGLRLARRIGAALYRTPLYAWTLPRAAPLELPVLPEDAWPGSAVNADRLFQGRFVFAGVEVVSPHAPPWTMRADELKLDVASFEAWAAQLHGFGWLRDFSAQAGDMARRMARSLLASWLEQHDRIQGLPWRADVAGRRLAHWLSHAHFLLQGADERFAHDFLLAIARHAAHLHRAARFAAPGQPRIDALLGLAYAAECLPRDGLRPGQRPFPDAVARLNAAVEPLVLADGGHAARSPSRVFLLLRDLVPLWLFLRVVDPERAALLQPHLDRMAPMLRFFRHGDGGLALFHGGEEEIPAQLEQVLDLSEAKGKPLSSAHLSSFERAAVRRALLLVDAGAPPPAFAGSRPHHGLLAFEFSHGKDRLIVNCGAARRPGGGWAAALSGIAAHATVALGNAEPSAAASVSATRNDQDGAIWFELEHDGWASAFAGRLHRRRLYLAASGEDLRGEDTITAPGDAAGRPPVEAVLRLHLHPGTHASALGSGDTVILKTGNGQGWRFRGAGGVVRLEDSVYFGIAGEPRRTQQIVMAGSAGTEPLTFKWALSKIG